MKLEIAGINHFDPLGRDKLKAWFEHVPELHGTRPSFIAVEWDEEQFAQVKSQRARFRDLVQRQWPGSNSDLVETLEPSLAYEGDTHALYYSDVPVTWLDQGRQNQVSSYAELRINLLRDFLGGQPMPTDTMAALDTLSRVARERAQPAEEGSHRDQRFAELIIQAVRKTDDKDWGIVIVGASHALPKPGTMLTLLQEQKIRCRVSNV